MAGTNAVAATKRLLDLLRDLTDDEVVVDFSYNGKTAGSTREYVYGGRLAGPVDLATMRPGGGRLARTEQPELSVHIVVTQPGLDSTEETHLRAVAIGVVLEELLAGNPTLGDLPDLKKAWITSWELEGAVDDDSAESVLTYQIGLMSMVR